MAYKHGVFISEQKTSVSTPVVAESGVPFVIGAAPIQSAVNPAKVGIPEICTSFDEFVEKFGWSEDWDSYNLCEFAYSQFKLYGVQPVIFCNLLDPTAVTPVSAADMAVTRHQVELPIEAVASTVVVKKNGGTGDAYAVDVDYAVFVNEGKLIVELLADGAHYSETSLNIAYSAVSPATVTAQVVAANMDAIELCASSVGMIPDIIVSPKYSETSTVAAIMATKAASINGVFSGKAIIDINSSSSGVVSYSGVSAYKNANNLVDENQIVCWPMVQLGEYRFHMSTALAGLIGSIDTDNDGAPYESPSNKNFKMDTLVLADGTEVAQTKAQADILNAAGVVTALNFLSSGWVCWGNFTACYPGNTDVKDYFIPISRMFDWVGNTLVKTFWSKLDQPMNRRLMDTIIDSANIWLNGLVSREFLLGARAEMLDAENPLTDLMSGIVRIHIYITPPAPAQEIDFVLEYDPEYVTAAFSE